MKERLWQLDSLRGIAALSVVLYHYFYRYAELFDKEGGGNDFVYYGQYGVYLFFIISGFVISMSLSPKTALQQFARSRFLRLYPVYWVAMCITFATIALVGLENREVPFIDFLFNFTMFQGFLGFQNVDGVYWTLRVELSFYALIGLFYYLTQRRFSLTFFAISWVVISFVLLNFWDIPACRNIAILIAAKFSIPFSLGIVFYEYYKGQSKPLTFFICQVLLLVILYLSSVLNLVDYDWLPILFCYALFCFSINCTRYQCWNSFLKKFTWFGTISYSLYLVHQNIGYIIIKYIESTYNSNILGVICALLFSILLARLLYVLIEHPVSILSKRWKTHEKNL
jgi:peptidoglycan/LPS O-acetylase OafA/YrhL